MRKNRINIYGRLLETNYNKLTDRIFDFFRDRETELATLKKLKKTEWN